MPPESAPKRYLESCEVKTPKDELDSLKVAIELSSGGNVVHVGPDRIPVVPYQELPKIHEDGEPITPSQYFDYLITIIDTPEDVFNLIRKPIMSWQRDKGEFDQLMSEEITMSNGGGDCDNIAWVAKRMLDALGCKKGVDYKARVIAAPGLKHAATLYTDESGQLRSIDLVYHHSDINNALSVSTIFAERYKDGNSDFYEVELHTPEVQVRRQIDPNDFNRVPLGMEVVVYGKNQDDFDPSLMLPPDYVNYQECRVLFPDRGYLRYVKGVLFQRDYPDGVIEHFHPNGVVQQRTQVDGTTEWFDESGRLTQRKLPDQTSLVFTPETGVLVQQNFASPQEDGSIIHRYFEDGETVKMRTYPEDHELDTVYFWENGQIRQKDNRARTAPYQRVFYNQEGQALQAETWDGERVDLDQE